MPTDYQKGVNDCLAGKPPMLGASNEYNRGYGDQYQKEQCLAAQALSELEQLTGRSE